MGEWRVHAHKRNSYTRSSSNLYRTLDRIVRNALDELEDG